MAEQTNIRALRQGRVSINDIKWDLIKIIDPYDGVLASTDGSERTVKRLFWSYLSDLKYANLVSDYNITSMIRDTAITYDIAVKMSEDRSVKKLKIHVGVYNGSRKK